MEVMGVEGGGGARGRRPPRRRDGRDDDDDDAVARRARCERSYRTCTSCRVVRGVWSYK